MRKIYLASKSKARKKLLRLLGLKFKVIPGKAKELRNAAGITFAALVKKNALAKAEGAAAKVKSGIVIGVDTVAVQGGEIFGKPGNLKKAQAMLKRLSTKPQWVYSGIAVIDKDKGLTRTACEKTKVYMDRLSAQEIRGYFAQVSPLDKAGSFDIQGRGAFFIRRIEGCFYNVVGLPLRRLYRMLKQIGVLALFLTLATCPLTLFLSGCASEYNVVTGKEETFYIDTDKEVQMGQSIAREVAKEYKSAPDPLMQKRVEDIGKKIAAVSDRKEIDYHFGTIDDDEVNAVSLPGGWVYVNKGLIEKVDNDDQLAAVLAHEVGHIVARHSIKKLQAMQTYSIFRILVGVTPGVSDAGNAADLAFTELLLGYGREDELLADQLGARYARLAGYNPRGMIEFLKKLQEINRRKPLQPKSYFKTHPYVPDRIRVVKEELGQRMNFKDYINIEQTKGE
jgi:MAF protein